MKTRFLLIALTAVLICGVSAPVRADEPAAAHEYFIRAADAMVEGQRLGTELTPEQLAQLVEKNQSALKLVRAGLSREYHYPPDLTIENALPLYAKWRQLARLLVAAGDARAAQNDWIGATDNYIDAIKLGGEVTRGGPLMNLLVGQAMQAIGRRPLEESLPRLDTAAAKGAAHKLEAIVAQQPTFLDTLRTEARFSENEFRKLLLGAVAPHFDDPQFRDAVIQHYHELLAGLIHEMDQPFPFFAQAVLLEQILQKAPTPQFPGTADLLDFPEPIDPNAPASVAQAHFSPVKPIYFISYFHDTLGRARNQLLLAALALRAYRHERGEFPTTLAELAPDYLKITPDDPFSAAKALRYKKDGETYLLYSLGPDGQNNAGEPIKNSDAPGRREYSVNLAGANARGDIVFGVNN